MPSECGTVVDFSGGAPAELRRGCRRAGPRRHRSVIRRVVRKTDIHLRTKRHRRELMAGGDCTPYTPAHLTF